VLDEDWQTTAERLWRSFVDLRQVVEDTDVSDRLEASDALRQFCRHAFELRDWLLASGIDQSAKNAVSQLFGKPSDKLRQTSPAQVGSARRVRGHRQRFEARQTDRPELLSGWARDDHS
jgi:cell division FtsZ-interacting protein ZapD